MIIGGTIKMGDKKRSREDGINLNESIQKRGTAISETNTRFTMEPSNEKEYDISLMTGRNTEKGSEGK